MEKHIRKPQMKNEEILIKAEYRIRYSSHISGYVRS